jgi:signal transduction histidine kinase
MHENITERKQAEEKLNRLNEELRTLKENIKHSIEESKKSLSQELHDNVLQDMAGNCYKLDGVSAEVASESLRKELNEITADLRRLLDITRDITTTLRPEMVEIHGIGTAIVHLAQNFSKKNKIQLKLDVNSEMQLPGNVSLQLYRILQEALANILKHAGASQVSISLKKTRTSYHFVIADNGKGFEGEASDTKPTFGIIIMKDRAASLGGSFDVRSKKGKGTTISIHLPLTIEDL